MNGMRNLLGLFCAVALAAFSLPGTAASPDKQFTINPSAGTTAPFPPTPSVLRAGTTTNVTVYFVNESPKSGNSYINSLILTLPTGVKINGTSDVTPLNGNVVACPTSTANGALPSGTNICVTNIVGIKPGGYWSMTVNATVAQGSACTTAMWLGQAFAGNSFSGNSFTDPSQNNSYLSQAPAYVGCDGVIGCGDSLSPSATNPNGLLNTAPGYSTGLRGSYNEDGGTTGGSCVKVGYDFTNYMALGSNPLNQLHLAWDLSAQPTAAFSYSANWLPVTVDPSSGWTALRPQVAWFVDSAGNPIYVPGLACLGPSLPAPYGTLVSDNGSDIIVSVTAPSLPSGQFPILVESERMEVQAVTATQTTGVYDFAVLRHQGNTTQVTHTGTNISVMSTPLPIIPNDPTVSLPTPYQVGDQARMCVAEHSWIPVGQDGSGNLLVQYFTTVFDTGDGFVTIR
jgi:hypothetical protein